MKKVTKLIAFLIIFALMLTLGACNLIGDGTVGSVNGEKITLAEYQYALNSVGAQMLQQAGTQNAEDFWKTDINGKNALQKARDDAFDAVARDLLIRQEAKNQGLTLEQADTDQIAQQKNQIFQQVGGKDAYDQRLKELGIDDTIYSDFMDRWAYAQKYQTYLTQNDERFKNPTDEDIMNYIKNNYVKTKHILFTTVDENRQPLPQDQIDQARAKAEDTLNRINAGEDFDTLMNSLSQDPGLAQNPDGYFFTKGQMVPEFEAAAFALQEGEVSQIVQSPTTGFHIIKRVPIDYSKDVTDQIKQQVPQQILTDNYNSLVEDLKSKANIVKKDNVINKLKVHEMPQASQAPQTQTQDQSQDQTQIQQGAQQTESTEQQQVQQQQQAQQQ